MQLGFSEMFSFVVGFWHFRGFISRFLGLSCGHSRMGLEAWVGFRGLVLKRVSVGWLVSVGRDCCR